MEIEEEKPATPPAPIPPARVFPGVLMAIPDAKNGNVWSIYTYKNWVVFFGG